MKVTFKPLSQQVMVITGASSGIGLATAQTAAARGARLVLAARNETALATVTDRIRAEGGQAIYVVADVGSREDVQRIADRTMQEFGTFDTWINDAGLSIWGRLEEISDEDHRRLFDVNFWGIVYGSLIAVGHLKKHGGTLINLGSAASDVAFPLQGMYSASKHAIKGFTDALRIELEEQDAPVSVTLIKPAAINTPFPHHARNYMESEPKLPPPVYHPQEVAEAILYAATHPERDIYVGSSSKMFSSINKTAPRVMDWVSRNLMVDLQKREETPRNPVGTLFEGGSGGFVDGDEPGYVMKTSLYTRASLHPLLTGAIVAGSALAMMAWLGRERG
ncbi:SDR family oxidoreductase [Larkinella soli]|uniref:SDR family oxidoreductase n=1 Tax=Larkinella soli TaxID=1770527 RepID=UPI000FFC1158|nr:SDR family oxidoreductase [Larkinella soli]